MTRRLWPLLYGTGSDALSVQRLCVSLVIGIGLTFAGTAGAQTCKEGRLALHVEYTVEDGMNAKILRKMGAPDGVRGIERQELIVQDDYRWQRTLKRFWKPDQAAFDAQVKALSEQAEAGIPIDRLPEAKYKIVVEDEIEVKRPDGIYRYDLIKRQGSKQVWPKGSDPRTTFSSPGPSAMLVGLAKDMNKAIKTHPSGNKTVAGYECELLEATQPFTGEICTARIGTHKLVLHQAFTQGKGLEYVKTAVKVEQTCVGPQRFEIPTDVAFR